MADRERDFFSQEKFYSDLLVDVLVSLRPGDLVSITTNWTFNPVSSLHQIIQDFKCVLIFMGVNERPVKRI